jgi:hypothetical protein
VPTNAFADLPPCNDRVLAMGTHPVPMKIVLPGKSLSILRQEPRMGRGKAPGDARPEKVYNVTVSDADSGGKRIAWDPVANHEVCYYRVYRMNIPKYRYAKKVQLGSTGGTTWVDTTAPAGKRVYYAVIVVDPWGNTSE